MLKKDVDDVIKSLIENQGSTRSCAVITMNHDGFCTINAYGPTGSISDFVFMEKALGNWLSDMMTGRLPMPGLEKQTTPPRLV